jgi:YfiH family protein
MTEWKYPLLSAFPEILHGTSIQAPSSNPSGAQYLLNPVQVHGNDFHAIDDPQAPLPPCDAIATSLKGIALMIRHADCQAALVYDPELQVIAAIHAGWRGLVQEIYPRTIAQLRDHYGCRPESLRIAISPSLGPENAEFIHYQKEFPQSFWPHQVKPYYFDLRAIAKEQLIRTGVLPEHLFISEVDTHAPSNGCPSYRRTKTAERMGSFISLVVDKQSLQTIK